MSLRVFQDLKDLDMEILPIRSLEIVKMMELARKYSSVKTSPRDIVHLSVMVNNNINKIISTDTHFDMFEEVKRIDPLDIL